MATPPVCIECISAETISPCLKCHLHYCPLHYQSHALALDCETHGRLVDELNEELAKHHEKYDGVAVATFLLESELHLPFRSLNIRQACDVYQRMLNSTKTPFDALVQLAGSRDALDVLVYSLNYTLAEVDKVPMPAEYEQGSEMDDDTLTEHLVLAASYMSEMLHTAYAISGEAALGYVLGSFVMWRLGCTDPVSYERMLEPGEDALYEYLDASYTYMLSVSSSSSGSSSASYPSSSSEEEDDEEHGEEEEELEVATI